MGKGLHKVFKDVVDEILQVLPILGKSGSYVSYFIPEPRNFVEVTKLSENTNKPWPKVPLKDIKNLFNNRTFIYQWLEKGKPMTPCMNVYKAKNKSDRSIDKLKLRIAVIGDLQNKELGGDNWSPTYSMWYLK